MPPSSKLTDAQRAELIRLAQHGWQASELAQKYGLSRQSIHRILTQAGLTLASLYIPKAKE